MKLHGNARTCLHSRLLMVRRAPHSIPHRTPEARVRAIAVLRRLRFTGAEIAEALAMPLSTVSTVLTRIEARAPVATRAA
jgi:hypothetical protein